MERLSTLLESYHLSALQEIADTIGLVIDSQRLRKGQLVSKLSRAIPKRAQSQVFIQSLSQAERAALGAMLEMDGEPVLTQRDLAVPLILAGLVGTRYTSPSFRLPRTSDVIGSLLRTGLIVNLADPGGNLRLRNLQVRGAVTIAREVQAALQSHNLPAPEPQAAILAPAQLPSLTIVSTTLAKALRELLFMWSEVRQKPAKALKTGGLSKRDRRRLALALNLDSEAGMERVTWLYELLKALHLVAVDEGAVVAVDSDAATLFWSSSPKVQLPTVIQGYTQLVSPIPGVPRNEPVSRYLDDAALDRTAAIRSAIVAALGLVADAGWIPLPAFEALITGDEPGVLALESSYHASLRNAFGWYAEGYRNELEESLHATEDRLTQGVLSELETLGIVDLGYAAADNGLPRGELLALRAAPAVHGYYAQREVPSASAQEPWQVILQPDFQVLAMGPVPLAILLNLEQFAAREKIDDSVVTYRITRDRTYTAFQGSETVASVLAYIEEATGQSAPQNVVRSLEEWYAQFQRIVFRRNVRLLQVDRPRLLETLLEDARLSEVLHPLEEHVAWFRPEDAGAVETGLLSLEMLPARSSSAASDLENSVAWRGDRLAVKAPTPSLHVTETLGRFAEADGDRWALTQESTQRAAAAGLDAPAIVKLVERMTGASLPRAWQRRLKAWAGHYGEGEIAHVHLLRFGRDGALEELRRTDSKLQQWLEPIPDSDHLAVVNDQHLAEVQDLLHTLGVEVSSGHWW